MLFRIFLKFDETMNSQSKGHYRMILVFCDPDSYYMQILTLSRCGLKMTRLLIHAIENSPDLAHRNHLPLQSFPLNENHIIGVQLLD
jgi:hypothetical protein